MKKSVSIVGAGALGKALAYSLIQVEDCDVKLYGRRGLVHEPFHVIDQHHLKRVEPSTSDSMASDLYFFTVKAYDLLSALDFWLPHIPPSSPLIFLSNGYIEPLLSPIRVRFPHHSLIKGLATRGAKFLPTGDLQLSDQGQISWGGGTSVGV